MRFAFAFLATFFALPANAATYLAEIHGILGPPINSSITDPHLSEGTELILKAQFTDDDYQLLPTPYYQIPLNAPISGDTFFRIDGGGLTWIAFDDISFGPGLTVASGKITSMGFTLVQSGDLGSPALDRPGLTTSTLGGVPGIFDADNLYFNQYKTPGFSVAWDYAGSSFRSIDSVPEPTVWAMLITGFGLAGANLRSRKKVISAAS